MAIVGLALALASQLTVSDRRLALPLEPRLTSALNIE
jgi:hypothetical protein